MQNFSASPNNMCGLVFLIQDESFKCISEIMTFTWSSIRIIRDLITFVEYENIGFIDKIHLFSLYINDSCIYKVNLNLFQFSKLRISLLRMLHPQFCHYFDTSLLEQNFWTERSAVNKPLHLTARHKALIIAHDKKKMCEDFVVTIKHVKR